MSKPDKPTPAEYKRELELRGSPEFRIGAGESCLAPERTGITVRLRMESAGHAWTEEKLRAVPKDGGKREVIDGEVVMSPAGYRHERVVATLLAALVPFASQRRLGAVCGSGLGCWMVSGNVLSPDASFIARERLGGLAVEREKFLRGAPDLVVEVLSPWDRSARLDEKIRDYLGSGARLVWTIDPEERTATVFRVTGSVRKLAMGDCLEGEDVMPGFKFSPAERLTDPSQD